MSEKACLRKLLLFMLAGSVGAVGQSGSVAGKIVDTEGSAISAKLVLVGEPSSGVQREDAADREGVFTLSPIATGRYALTIRAPGFLKRTIPNIIITSDRSSNLGTIVLEVAGCFAPGVICDSFGLRRQ